MDRLAFGDYVLERSQKRLLRSDGTVLELTPRLFNALQLFVDSAGQLIEKDTLMRVLWPGLVVEENNLSQVVSSLRKALGDDAQGSRFIQTVPRRGFRFVAKVEAVAELPPGPGLTASPKAEAQAASVEPTTGPAAPPTRRWLLATAAAAVAGVAATAWWAERRSLQDGATATLAVLPFKPLTADGRDELLEIGMADSLTSRLSALPGLVLRSTASVQRYAGAAQDPLQAARELDVQWVVDGTLQRRGEQLRATARLLRVADGTAAWSGSFDARMGDVFDVQDQIAARVHMALGPMLQRTVLPTPALAELGGTRNPEAYQLYLAASWRAQGGRPENIRRAIELLQRALALDPEYALAWTSLAWAHRRRLWNADAVPAEVFAAGDAALARALELAPQLPQAIAGRGFTRSWYAFDWPGAEAEFRRGLGLNANVLESHHGLAMLLLPQGRIDEGWSHLRRTLELDPMSPVFNTLMASYLVDRGMLDEADRRLDIALELAPQLWLAHVAQGLLWMARKRPGEAIAELRRAAELGHGISRPKAVLGAHLALLGQADEARTILSQLQRKAADAYVPATSTGMLLAALGDKAGALDALEQALRWRDVRLIYLKDDPSWHSLHGEPRFQTLLRQLKLDGLPQGLTPV